MIWKKRIAIAGTCCLIVTFSLFGASVASAANPLSQVLYWGYQIQGLDSTGAIDTLVNSQYDMLVLEPTVTHNYEFDAADMVQRIKASKAGDGVRNKLAIAYIDIGQAEEWRWYWRGETYETDEQGNPQPCQPSFVTAIQQEWAPWVLACDPDGWGGNYPVAYWTDAWKNIVIYGTNTAPAPADYFNSLLDEVIEDGFDGVYLDWVEAWENEQVAQEAQNEGKDPAQEMLKLIQEIRTYGKQHNPDFLVIQQNSANLINALGANGTNLLKTAVDAIAQEGVWWEGDATDEWSDPNGYDDPVDPADSNDYLVRLRQYQHAGFPVFVCEYALNNAANAYQQADNEGFIGYTTRRALSQLTTTPPDFTYPENYLLWTH